VSVPVGAIVVGLIALFRAFNALGKASTKAPTSSRNMSRGSAPFWSDGGAFGTVLLHLVLGTVLSTALVALTAGVWGAVPWVVVPLLFLFPWPFTRMVLIPLGLVRLAYTFGTLSRIVWRRDRPGGPVFCAAWALLRAPRRPPATVAWLEAKLRREPDSARARVLQGSTVAAMGFLAAARGRYPEARRWLESVVLLDPLVAPRLVRAASAEWLASDAAARGDWRRVRGLASRRVWPLTRALRLLDCLARRILGESPPSNAAVMFYWLLAPRRLHTARFVWSQLRQAPFAERIAMSAPSDPGLPGALKALLRLRSGASWTELKAAAEHWEEIASGDALNARMLQLALQLGIPPPSNTLADLAGLASGALGDALPALSEEVTEELPACLEGARLGRRDAAFQELETRMEALEKRREAGQELPSVEEWRELGALLERYDACASGSLSDRGIAFAAVKNELCNFGAWLFNIRDERPMAHAVFRFLAAEAAVVGDSASEKLNRSNMACGI
jgi:hypothetical protein